jgi:phosphate transport system permease protein
VSTASAPVPSAADRPAVRPLAKKRGRPGDAIFHALLLLAIGLALGALAWLFTTILVNGLPQLDWAFLTDKTSTNPERAGFASALRGSLVLMLITICVALPVGFAGAVYLEKFAALSRDQLLGVARRRERLVTDRAASGQWSGPRLSVARAGVRVRYAWAKVGPPVNTALEVNISNLAAVPSIIYGLLGLAVFVSILGLNKSLLAGGLTLAILILPIVIIASREAVRAVPVSIEQGAMALGATRWQAVSRQVVPAAFPGMLTGAILAISRAIGESAPLIVVGGISFGTQLPSINPLESGDTPLFAMPLQIYFWADQPREEFRDLAASGIIILLGTLIVINLVAIWLRNRYTRRW